MAKTLSPEEIREVKFCAKWIAGDLFYRNGLTGVLDSKDSEYDEAVTGVFEPVQAAFIGESPRDPYEYKHAMKFLEKHSSCPMSIGGMDGTLWQEDGTWQSKCKIFY